ncbi:MAG: LutC/YkgG family protein [Prolixibacteraceae bacterium]
MSREAILEKIRQSKPHAKAHPGIIEIKKSDNTEQLAGEFSKQATLVGAEVTELTDKKQVEQLLSEQYAKAIDFRKEKNRKKYGTGCSKEKLEKLKTVILEGKFGVAENGAVWIDESNFPNRLIPFITEQLIILVPKKNLVSRMHEAYEIIGNTDYKFGVFISGPSKTADIEQSLVYGAHGAIKLSVILN